MPRFERKRSASGTIPALVLVTLSVAPRLAHATTYSWTNPTDAFWSTPSNWSPAGVPTSADDATFNLNSPYTASVTGNQSVNNLTLDAPSATLLLQSSPTYNAASLTAANDINVTAGRLQLQSVSGYSASLSVGGALTVGPAGHLDLLTPASGAPATFSVAGIVNNSGNLYVGVSTNFNSTLTNYATLAVGSSDSSPAPVMAAVNSGIFVQSAGTLYFNDNATLRVHDGGFVFAGGSIQRSTAATPFAVAPTAGGGSVVLTGASGLLTSTPDGGGATFSAFQNFSLYGDLAPNTTVHLTSNSHLGYGTLNLADNATNHGTLSVHADDGYTTTIKVGDGDGGGNLNNHGTLNVLADPTPTPVYFNGVLTNTGTVNASAPLTLYHDATNTGSFNVSPGTTVTIPNATFNQNAGTLGNAAAASSLNVINGAFNYNGGTVALPVTLSGSSTLSAPLPDGHGAVFNASQSTVSLIGDFPANATLNSAAVTYYSTLVVQDNATNRGHILLRSDNGYTTTLRTNADSGNFNNASLLEFSTNAPGSSSGVFINTTLVNTGTINADANLSFNQNVSNAGNFNVGNSASLTMANARFNQDAGHLGNSGATHFRINNGGFNFNGGSVGLTVDLHGSHLSTPVADAGGAAFNFLGTGTLHGNLAPGASLFSVANSAYGYTTLYVDAGAHNNGSITLSALNGYTNTLRVGAGDALENFYNHGSISYNADPSSRIITYGNVVNAGNLNLAGHTTFQGAFADASGSHLNVSGTNSTLDILGAATINGQMIASSGAQIVSHDGGGLVAAGAGNLLATGGGSLIAAGAGNLISQDGAGVVSNDGASVVSNDGGSIVSHDGGGFTVGAGGSLIATFISHNGNSAPTGVDTSADHVFSPTSLTSPTPSLPLASIVAQSGGTVSLQGGTLHADNLLQIDAGGTLSGFGTASASAASSAGTIHPAGGTLTLNAPLTLAGGSVDGPGALAINGPLTVTANASLHATTTANSLTIDGGAVLDLTTSTVTLSAADLTTLRQYLHDSLLLSSTADADPQHRLALGYLLNPDNSITINTTYLGDANLDGRINADDYALLDRAYARSQSNAHWSDGDFNYDGTVTSADYLLIDTTLGQAQGFGPGFLSQRESQFGPDYVSQLLVSIPEPSSAALLLPTLLPFARRRRTPIAIPHSC